MKSWRRIALRWFTNEEFTVLVNWRGEVTQLYKRIKTGRYRGTFNLKGSACFYKHKEITSLVFDLEQSIQN